MTRKILLALVPLVLFVAACSSNSTPALRNEATWRPAFSETEVAAGYPGKLEPGMSVLLGLEPAGASPAAGSDTGTAGVDSFPFHLNRPVSLRLCFRSAVSHRASVRAVGGGALLTVTASSDPACAGPQLTLAPGDYALDVSHAGTTGVTYPLLLSITSGTGGSARRAAATAGTGETITLETVPAYDPTATYQNLVPTYAQYGDVIYFLKYWADAYNCPVQDVDPKCTVTAGQWVVYDPNVKTEAQYYDYAALQASYPNPPACAAADYGIPAMRARIDASIASGEMALAAPQDGFGPKEVEALYREAMLPCLPPDLSTVADANLPPNVRTVKAVMPLATWQQFASKVASVEPRLPKADGSTDSARAYWQFLSAVARYPYFCGEVGGRDGDGAFDSVENACRRELASLLAHAAQETGGGALATSFEYLREGGQMDNKNYLPGQTDVACPAPFECSNAWSLYYGRGPKQLTHFYNYAGFSAARFVDGVSDVDGSTVHGFNYLLVWPDLVAYDPELYFLSAIWFAMTNQPPKPSMHDVILRRYAPDASCTDATCAGLGYDAATGLAHPFTGTIELINGGVECRATMLDGNPTSPTYMQQIPNDNVKPTHRSDAYKAALAALGATLSTEERDLPAGCLSIIQNPPPGQSAFAVAALNPGYRTWLDFSGSSCQAQNIGGPAMMSVTAPGVVTACRSK